MSVSLNQKISMQRGTGGRDVNLFNSRKTGDFSVIYSPEKELSASARKDFCPKQLKARKLYDNGAKITRKLDSSACKVVFAARLTSKINHLCFRKAGEIIQNTNRTNNRGNNRNNISYFANLNDFACFIPCFEMAFQGQNHQETKLGNILQTDKTGILTVDRRGSLQYKGQDTISLSDESISHICKDFGSEFSLSPLTINQRTNINSKVNKSNKNNKSKESNTSFLSISSSFIKSI